MVVVKRLNLWCRAGGRGTWWTWCKAWQVLCAHLIFQLLCYVHIFGIVLPYTIPCAGSNHYNKQGTSWQHTQTHAVDYDTFRKSFLTPNPSQSYTVTPYKLWTAPWICSLFRPRPAVFPAGRPAASMWPGRPASAVFPGRPAKLAGWLAGWLFWFVVHSKSSTLWYRVVLG